MFWIKLSNRNNLLSSFTISPLSWTLSTLAISTYQWCFLSRQPYSAASHKFVSSLPPFWKFNLLFYCIRKQNLYSRCPRRGMASSRRGAQPSGPWQKTWPKLPRRGVDCSMPGRGSHAAACTKPCRGVALLQLLNWFSRFVQHLKSPMRHPHS